LADAHNEGQSDGKQAAAPYEAGQGKSSPRRLIIVTIIMLGFAFLTFAPALFSRGATGLRSTGTNLPNIFIPVWLTLTIGTLVISLWFARYILIAEKSRDSETVTPSPAPSHSQ
jgi:hypothetical protein